MDKLQMEINTLPVEYTEDVVEFIKKLKKGRHMTETMLFAETSLIKDWGTLEEDAAWANL